MWPVPLTPPPSAAAHETEVARALACKARHADSAEPALLLHEQSGVRAVSKPSGAYTERAAEHCTAPCGPWAPVHRLDRDTSGVLLLATAVALPRLSALFAQPGCVRKAYVGLVSAAPPGWPAGGACLCSGHGRSAGGLWRAYSHADVGRLLPNGSEGMAEPTSRKRAVVREMATHLTFFGSAPALLLARPLQGKTHQIRIHAALAGAPLIGDVRYGGEASSALDAVMLHAARLTLPAGGSEGQHAAPLVIRAPLPSWCSLAGVEALHALEQALEDETWTAGPELFR